MKFGIVNITSFCNQKCIFCSEGDMHNNPKHIKKEKVFDILLDLKKNGVEGINFMGGECTLRSDLGDILDFCNRNFKTVSIVTNGIMFSNKLWCNKILGKINSFEFSWHTNNEEKFGYLSGSKTYKLFQKSLINISDFLEKNNDLGIVINHVINKVNYMDISLFITYAINTFPLSARKNRVIALKRTNIVGYSVKNISNLSVCPSEVLPYLLNALDICIKNNVNVQIEGFPPCYFKKFFSSENFLINEIELSDLFLLNKIDISFVNDVSIYRKNEIYDKSLYNKGDILLNKEILLKCKKCYFRNICHKKILFGNDSNRLNKNILNYIGNNVVLLEDFNSNIKKRDIFIKNFFKGSI